VGDTCGTVFYSPPHGQPHSNVRGEVSLRLVRIGLGLGKIGLELGSDLDDL
jgi:hypothetical protein